MKTETISLDEAYKLVKAQPNGWIDKDAKVSPRVIMDCLQGHAFRVLPEVVATMRESIPVLRGQFNEDDRRRMADMLELILAKASTVEVPES